MGPHFTLQARKRNIFKLRQERDEEKKRASGGRSVGQVRGDEDVSKALDAFVREFGDGASGSSEAGRAEPAASAARSGSVHQQGFLGAFGEDEDEASPPSERENLKRDQEDRELLRKTGVPVPGDSGPSTNLVVNYLAPAADEALLMREFGRFGPLASVKILWPRDEEQRRRGWNPSFVAFMRRGDAERALDALDGVALLGSKLELGWAKPVALPSAPIWPPAAGREGKGDGSLDGDGHSLPPASRDIEVVPLHDPRQCFVIDAVACHVLRGGRALERALAKSERSNPEFAFLRNAASPEALYYRWRLLSLVNGDGLRAWRIEPFKVVMGGRAWVPPPMMVVAAEPARARGSNLPAAGEGEQLPEAQRARLSAALSKLAPSRASIEEGMLLVLENASSAPTLADMLVRELTTNGSTVPRRVALLFLVSDVLHNSSAPVRHAPRLRAALQARLPEAFEALAAALNASTTRLEQGLLRRHVLATLAAWRSWFIFPSEYVDGLQATFLGGGRKEAEPELEPGLEDLSEDELRALCAAKGLTRGGGKQELAVRLTRARDNLTAARLRGDMGGDAAAGGTVAAASASPATSAPAAKLPALLEASSGWEPVAAEPPPAWVSVPSAGPPSRELLPSDPPTMARTLPTSTLGREPTLADVPTSAVPVHPGRQARGLPAGLPTPPAPPPPEGGTLAQRVQRTRRSKWE